MPDRWQWVLYDHTGTAIPGRVHAYSRRLIYTRNHAAVARLRLGLSGAAATSLFDALRNGVPQLGVWRNDEHWFTGHWRPMTGAGDTDQWSYVDLTFTDAFGLLADRLTVFPLEQYADEQSGLIAQGLIDASDSTYGPTPIDTTTGVYETTKIRSVDYVDKTISEAITELTTMGDGAFDWYPTYLEPGTDPDGYTMILNVVASRGSDRSDAIFEYGVGTLANCTSYSFTTGTPLNIVRAIGSGGVSVEEEDADSIARYGPFMGTVSATDQADAVILSDLARDALRPDPLIVTEFRGDPARCPRPQDKFWIGDTVRLNITDGALQAQLAPRVQTLEIGLDDEDNIADLVIGIDEGATGSFRAPTATERRYVQQQQAILRRLSGLERAS